MRIDSYIHHLLRSGANRLELTSNQPACFHFNAGERLGSNPVSHKEIIFLLQEMASSETLLELKRNGRIEFSHDSGEALVSIVVEAKRDAWKLIVTPQAGQPRAQPTPAAAAASETGGDARPVPPAAARPTSEDVVEPRAERAPSSRRSVRPPTVEGRAGEPRINQLLREMAKLDASDLHLSTGVAPLIRLHGSMQTLEGHPVLSAEELRNYLEELIPQRNRQEFEQDWDTDFSYAIEGVARFRVNYFYDRNGPGAVFRQIPYKILTARDLGLPQKLLDLCWLTKGLVVVAGPTGSGKSTTLAALIDFINENRADHIITIEDPVEFVHPNKRCLINQREVGTHTRSFKTALRAALREDPDVVLVGELRDLETTAIALETAETGHLVFGTLHTNSATSTVDRIIDQFPVNQQEQIRIMLSETLRGVIAQVLCKKRQGGRVAALETFICTPASANLIREGKTYQLTSVLQTGRKLGSQTMNDHLLQLVSSGQVAAEEAFMKSNDKGSFREALKTAGISLNM